MGVQWCACDWISKYTILTFVKRVLKKDVNFNRMRWDAYALCATMSMVVCRKFTSFCSVNIFFLQFRLISSRYVQYVFCPIVVRIFKWTNNPHFHFPLRCKSGRIASTSSASFWWFQGKKSKKKNTHLQNEIWATSSSSKFLSKYIFYFMLSS